MNQQPDKLFREKLAGFQKTVPASAWNNVEARLNKKNNKGLWLKIAASLLLLAVTVFLLLPANSDDQLHQTSQNNSDKETLQQKETLDQEKKEEILQQPVAELKKPSADTPVKGVKETGLKYSESKTKKTERRSVQTDIGTPPGIISIEKQEEKIIQQLEIKSEAPEIEALPTETLLTENTSTIEDEGVTLIFSAEQVNEKYLNKKSLAQATPGDKKTSTLRKLLDKAYDLKHNQDPFGDLRQKKNEILALNFRSEKQRSQNK